MKLIEHLEYVIGLIGKAKNAEIKGALLAMYEEVAGKDRAFENQVALNKEHAEAVSELTTRYAKLEKEHLDFKKSHSDKRKVGEISRAIRKAYRDGTPRYDQSQYEK